MAITLSHQSALDVTREVRAKGSNLHEFDSVPLMSPSAWVGSRLSARNFDPAIWNWQRPTAGKPLHVLVPYGKERLRGKGIVAHRAWRDMPGGSVLWLDDHSSMVCPELLFLQMADSFSFPALVMLGLELCGHFSRCSDEPLAGLVTDGIPAATSVESLKKYLSGLKKARGLPKAQKALRYVCDHAVSAPEAVLAIMYSLPPVENGYGMGPLTLNDCVRVDDAGLWERNASRYPDLSFGFAPMGINYDGSKHFDMDKILVAAEALACADAGAQNEARATLKQRLAEVRAKVLDDNVRNRQLAAQGRIVFPATKEDLADGWHLDALTSQVLRCAHEVFGADVGEYERTLDDTSLKHDRWELLRTLMPHGRHGESSYGKV